VPRLLHIAASPRLECSHSRRGADAAIRYWQSVSPRLSVLCRELAAEPVPHPSAGFVSASLRQPDLRTEVDRKFLNLSELLIEELMGADALLISLPMHNFSLPSVLKAWIDQVVRPGRTFRTTDEGKEGMLANRPVRVIMACGGRLRGHQQDWATPYLRYVCNMMGMNDFQSFVLERCNRGEEEAKRSRQELATWLTQHLKKIQSADGHFSPASENL